MSNKVFLNEKIAKKLFKNEKYGKILSAKVISDVLDADYNEVFNNIMISSEEIALSSLTVNSTADSIYYDDKIYYNIELNFHDEYGKKIQLLSYICQLIIGQIHTHKDYTKVKKIVQISIDAFDFFKQNEFMYNVLLMEEKHKIPYNDLIQIIHVNLDYIRKVDYNEIAEGTNKLMRDLYFLISGDNNKMNIVYERDDLMKKIIEEANQIAGIDKLDLYISEEDMRIQDEKKAREEGRQEGIMQGIMQTAKNMLNKGILVDTISEVTGLSLKQIEELK